MAAFGETRLDRRFAQLAAILGELLGSPSDARSIMRVYAGRLNCLTDDVTPARQSKRTISAAIKNIAKTMSAVEGKGNVRRKC